MGAGFTLLETFGVRVVEVEDLGVDADYLHDRRVLLVDEGLTPDQRDCITDQVVMSVLAPTP